MDFAKENLLKKIIIDGNNYQNELEPFTRKKSGVYYTDLLLTDILVKNLFDNMSEDFKRKIFFKSFFEPCVGSGNFVFSYLKYIYENFTYTDVQIETLIYNIYVCDSDEKSLKIFYHNFISFCKIFFNIDVDKQRFSNNIGNYLLFDTLNNSTNIVGPINYFNRQKFDVIMTNPPYKNMKAEKSHYENEEQYRLDREYYAHLKEIIKNEFNYQGKGTVNLYKLFMERILCSYLKKDGYSYLLVPQSILKDVSSASLRKFMLKSKNVLSIINIDENKKYIDANQSLSAILVSDNGTTQSIELIDHLNTDKEKVISVNSDVYLKNENYSIMSIDRKYQKLFMKMNSLKKIKDFDFIINYRGEFDVTNNKDCFTNKSNYYLLRGRNVSLFKLKDLTLTERVSKQFVYNSSKKSFINSIRICCKQISNMKSKKRLVFSYVPQNYVLANSCNFIKVFKNIYGIDEYFLLGILNSDIYEWYFRLFSSNNHISNYEIDNLPVPIMNATIQSKISSLVKRCIHSEVDCSEALSQINEIINQFFEWGNETSMDSINEKALKDILLSFPYVKKDDVYKILMDPNLKIDDTEINSFQREVIKSIKEKYNLLEKNMVLNHTSFKLSDLDMQVVRSVKPGGNWKQIPLEVAKKSKRIMRIRETGGRTTLYGRLDYEKPSYTITTYFNRPGNGTNIHPKHNRVITVREAARIQSFPDSYLFYGNQKNKLTQIGNAVPPYMSYQIARRIKEKINVCKSLDLFCGAGGMTTGFKIAGYNTVLMNDIDRASLVTAKINYPKAKAFLGDLTDKHNREYIINYSKEHRVDIINGGPPCQGFSLAGFRNINDPRSKLIFDYVKVLKEVFPKVFVFENVQGILSHNKGETFKELMLMFSEVGYDISAKLLDFSNYGIPQKRKRVIIIGVRKDLGLSPDTLFPDTNTTEDVDKISVKDAIYDLEDVKTDKNSYYTSDPTSMYSKLLRGSIAASEYIDFLNKKNSNKFSNKQLSLFE